MENVLKHRYVPKHTIMTEEEVQTLLKELNISKIQLPKIFNNDPAGKAINAKRGDVIKVERKSPTAKRTIYYRCVVDA